MQIEKGNRVRSMMLAGYITVSFFLSLKRGKRGGFFIRIWQFSLYGIPSEFPYFYCSLLDPVISFLDCMIILLLMLHDQTLLSVTVAFFIRFMY